jgi:glyoxylase-like metal-dependent hydrolase (beta-lactamase superfamily II)
VLVREHPGLTVHVSAVGLPHLVDPGRLETSARRLYGEAFDALWGELAAVPADNVRPVGDHVAGLACFPTTGHAPHHVSYLHEDGTLYAGDAAGVRIDPGRFVFAPTPPPDVDLEAWERTLDEIARRAPRRLALVHFGVFDDVERHLAALRETMHEWGERVAHGMDEATFVKAARADVAAAEPGEAEAYDRAAPYWHCFRGLERYWRKRAEASAAV